MNGSSQDSFIIICFNLRIKGYFNFSFWRINIIEYKIETSTRRANFFFVFHLFSMQLKNFASFIFNKLT